ncbi:hypothetical protein P154DRAFT_538819 [Amniculicola lignicola CBS 123094]|uniref:Uncharacterized protein n=1 Tax=Amniculicola lignicola CBS 123094 TaxID=1392246 RepID=A0A6A5W3D8_9PLEO|nr:hypothetical protein P154DRAFT_538819 [Amniculicola lignicola CBS 123094]
MFGLYCHWAIVPGMHVADTLTLITGHDQVSQLLTTRSPVHMAWPIKTVDRSPKIAPSTGQEMQSNLGSSSNSSTLCPAPRALNVTSAHHCNSLTTYLHIVSRISTPEARPRYSNGARRISARLSREREECVLGNAFNVEERRRLLELHLARTNISSYCLIARRMDFPASFQNRMTPAPAWEQAPFRLTTQVPEVFI